MDARTGIVIDLGLLDRIVDAAPTREIWHKPLFTVNGDHIISKVLGLCAAENIFADLPRLAGEVSVEQVLIMDPDVIVVGSEADDAGALPSRTSPQLSKAPAGLQGVDAVEPRCDCLPDRNVAQKGGSVRRGYGGDVASLVAAACMAFFSATACSTLPAR